MEDILALIGRVHQGDKEARDILAEKYGAGPQYREKISEPGRGDGRPDPDRKHRASEGH